MKAPVIALALIVSIVTALAFSAPASADNAQVSANGNYQIEVGEFGIPGPLVQGSDLTFTWSSTLPLTLVVAGPSGTVESYSSNTHGSDTIEISETGTYFMTWTNSGSSVVSLTYNYDVDIFGPVHDVIDSLLLGVIVAAIVIVVIIVLVVVLVIRGGEHKRPTQGQQYVPPTAPLAPIATACPNCGAAIDASTQWCSRCGTRLR